MNNDNNINTIIINCPHCNEEVLIFSYEINCGILREDPEDIFRHGVFKSNMCQINPHLPKIKPGILPPYKTQKNTPEDTLERMNLLYSKNFSILFDIQVIISNWKKLDL